MAKRKRKKAGLPPGSIIFTGKRKVEKIDIHYLEYNESILKEQLLDNQSIKGLHQPSEAFVQWYDIRGLHDTVLLEEIGKTFRIHPLALEDVANTQQRPKFDEYELGNFISLKALSFDANNKKILPEQVSIYFGEGFLLSFQEVANDLFTEVRNRLKSGLGRIRKRGADYLAYALMDMIVDQYFSILDEIEEEIEDIELEILERVEEGSKGRIHQLKQEMLVVRKSIAPLREAINRFAKSESELVKETSVVFLRDLYDHTVQIIDLAETYRDMLMSLQDLYLSEISFRMNNVMQVLTIIATIFIPLTFLAGIYGMNFDHMPELHWRYSYFVLWGVMAMVFILLLVYFKRRKWI